MQLIQEVHLHFQDAKSDKVYEVYLYEVGNDQYLVNFKYGRRGANLKEGTKTDQPVNRAKADSIFEKLVSSKTKKGYQQVQTNTTSSTPPPPSSNWDREAATHVLLTYLQEAINNPTSKPSEPKKDTTNSNNNNRNKPQSVWGAITKWIKGEDTTNNNPTSSATNDDTPRQRPISRIVWRVGELRIKEATPLLLQLPITDKIIDQYSLVWALGRCGDPSAIPTLENMLSAKDGIPAVQLLAAEAKMALLDKAGQKSWSEVLFKALPIAFQNHIQTENIGGLINSINEQIEDKKEAYQLIAHLYLISNHYTTAKQAVHQWVQAAPFKGSGYFKSIRQLYKTAEFRDDAALWGLIVHRVYTSRAPFYITTWSYYYRNDGKIHCNSVFFPNENSKRKGYDKDYNYVRGDYIRTLDEVKKPNSRLGFSEGSKKYIQKRSWRVIKRQAEAGEAMTYVKMAVGFLLAFTDEDKQDIPPFEFYRYKRVDGRWRSIRELIHYPPYANYSTFNHILYSNSPRFEYRNNNNWVYKKEVSKDTPAPTTREEAYPHFWDEIPQGILHLLAESNCEAVNEFAVKAAKANLNKITPLINVAFIKLLLNKKYKDTALLSIELAKAIYDPSNPDTELILALLNAVVPEARNLGLEWLRVQKDFYFQDADFVTACVFNPHKDIQEELDNLLGNHTFSDDLNTAIVAKVTARLLAYPAEVTDEDRKAILQAAEYLNKHFTATLQQTSIQTIQDFLDHPVSEVKVFGAKILLNHPTDIKDLPEQTIASLINGESAEMRAVGTQLLGKLPKEELLKKQELLKELCLSPHPEVRQSIQKVIAELANENKEFGDSFTQQIVPQLLKREEHEGRDTDISTLLKDHLSAHLPTIPLRMILKLIYSPRQAANQMGGYLLVSHVKEPDLKMRQIVRLANHEMQEIRDWVKAAYNNNIPRVKYELKESIRLVDAKWDDSREFAFNYFRQQLSKEDWTPDILVSICDSVNVPVQQFGKEMITRFFEEKNGEQYLLQLSQHPTADLQSFATNYLDRFASDNPENIVKLELYFVTVLSGVNKSRVAKKRIFEFLRKEGLKSEETAKLVAGILKRQSATMAIGDKAKCISIMRDLDAIYPNLELPIKVKEVADFPINT